MITVESIEKKEMAELLEAARKENNLVVRSIVVCTLVLCKFIATIRSNQLLTEDEKKAIRAKQEAGRKQQK
jgi:hypothetical protein